MTELEEEMREVEEIRLLYEEESLLEQVSLSNSLLSRWDAKALNATSRLSGIKLSPETKPNSFFPSPLFFSLPSLLSLSSQMSSSMWQFDAELCLLRHEKLCLDIQMKLADLRHVTLFQELLLLKEFEKRENSLQDRLNSCVEEEEDLRVPRWEGRGVCVCICLCIPYYHHPISLLSLSWRSVSRHWS